MLAVTSTKPQRLGKQFRIVGGVVGAAGGLGGFVLPTRLGGAKQWTGEFAGGFVLFSMAAFAFNFSPSSIHSRISS